MTITVDVTERDIAIGARRSCEYCPIARALARAVGGKPSVHSSYARIGESHYNLPPEAAQFVASFDKREPVEPFSFTLSAEDTQ